MNIIRTLTINYYSLLLNLRPTTDLFSEDQGQDDVEIEEETQQSQASQEKPEKQLCHTKVRLKVMLTGISTSSQESYIFTLAMAWPSLENIDWLNNV